MLEPYGRNLSTYRAMQVCAPTKEQGAQQRLYLSGCAARSTPQTSCLLLWQVTYLLLVWSSLAGYEISERAETWWLYSSAAMYALVHTAVHNPTNAFFIFISESCVPLYRAALVYLEVIHEPKSRLNPGCQGAPDFGRHPTPPLWRRRRVTQQCIWPSQAKA